MTLVTRLLANKNILPFGERASKAGTVTLLGMGAIFGVLALLWGAIELVHFCLSVAEQKKAKQAGAQATSTEPATVPGTSEPADDGALIAAITAAITAARAEEGNTAGFRVVSFRRSR